MLLKHMKIRPHLHICLNNSAARPSFKNLRGVFFSYQVAKDAENVFTFEKGPLVAELKLKVSKKAKSTILNFSSAIRGHLENVNTLLKSLVTWSKSCPSDF